MALRREHKKNKVVSDISSIESRVAAMNGQVNTIFADLVKVKALVDTRPGYSDLEKAEMLDIIEESYKLLWDEAVARTPIEIKETNRA